MTVHLILYLGIVMRLPMLPLLIHPTLKLRLGKVSALIWRIGEIGVMRC
jgi:hypothetical protein